MAVECDRWNWRELIASEHGPRSPTTRHILLTLSLHMNEHGESAFPSQATLAVRCKLTERAIGKHLNIAEGDGFIAIYQRRRPKQAWFVHEYVATIPDALAQHVKHAPWEEDPKWKRPERGSTRLPNGGQDPERGARRPEPDDATGGTSFHNAPNDVPTNSSSNSSNNFPKKRAAEDRTTDVFLNKGETKRDSERKHQPFPETPTSAQEAFQGKSLKSIAKRPASGYVYSDEELEAKIEKLRLVQAEPETVVAILRNYATEERIRRILSHKYGVPWISAA